MHPGNGVRCHPLGHDQAGARHGDYKRAVVIYADDQVCKVFDFLPHELEKTKLFNGIVYQKTGWTEFEPAFQYIYDNYRNDVNLICYLTDGGTDVDDVNNCNNIWNLMGRPAMIWALASEYECGVNRFVNWVHEARFGIPCVLPQEALDAT